MTAATYCFGKYELDLGLHELRQDGEPCAIEPQAFDLLAYLIEHRDRLVGKDELNQEIWQGRFVTDAALNTYIKLARQAIGDDGRRQEMIRTVRGKGFRFVGELGSGAAGVEVPAGKRGFGLAVMATLLVLSIGGAIIYWTGLPLQRPSIAVLPFDNMSEDKAQEFFADGMTDDLITHLSKVDGLSVIARNSTFTYKGRHAKVQDIANDLGVRYVLEGSVRRSGGTIRINAQLTDGESGEHLWAEIFDREEKDIFALQDEVIQKIVTALRIKLTADDRRRLAEYPTDNPEAYALYLRARRLHLNYEMTHDSFEKRRDIKEAMVLYQKAIDLDPTFAAAYAGIANVAINIWRATLVWIMDSREALILARQSATRALKFDPRNAEAYDALSIIHFIEMAPDKGMAKAEKSLGLNPDSAIAHATLAHALAISGRFDEAKAQASKAIALDPSPNTYVGAKLAAVFFLVGQYEKAAALFAFVTTQAPKWTESRYGLIVSNTELGRIENVAASMRVLKTAWAAMNWQLIGVLNRHWHPDAWQKWLSALDKAGVPEWPYGFKDDPAKRLSGAEIQGLVVGKRMQAKAIYNMGVDIDVYVDGRMAYHNPWATTKGNWALEEEKSCWFSPIVFSNRRYCGYFYRNEAPSKEHPQPFIYINIWDRYYFRIGEIQSDKQK